METVYPTIISFVIPCYRSENTISQVVDEIRETVKTRPQYDYEIILVNDGSTDRSLEISEDMPRRSKNQRNQSR